MKKRWILLIGLLLLTSCAPEEPAAEPVGIAVFSVIEGPLVTKYYFGLTDAEGNYVPTVANISFKLVDIVNDTLYEVKFEIKAKDFEELEHREQYSAAPTPITGFKWHVNIDEVKKGIGSYGYGTGFLTIEMSDGKIFSSEGNFRTPGYSPEELEILDEQKFSENAIILDQSRMWDDLRITAIRAGEYTDLTTLSSGHDADYYRVDMEVTNLGFTKEHFRPLSLVLISGDKQYEAFLDPVNRRSGPLYPRMLDVDKFLFPNVRSEGFLIFQTYEPVTTPAILIVEQCCDAQLNRVELIYEIG